MAEVQIGRLTTSDVDARPLPLPLIAAKQRDERRGNAMLKTIAAFDRIGEENAFAVLARANALAAQGRDIINLGIGQPDFRTPEHIVEAAIKALRDGHHGYTPANGIPPLREAVAADLHKRFKVEVSPDERDDHAGRQADHVHVDPDVRRARRRHPLSRSRASRSIAR